MSRTRHGRRRRFGSQRNSNERASLWLLLLPADPPRSASIGIARRTASLMLLIFAALLPARANAQHPTTTPRPNIIFIMADDHAAHALSCYGSKINTTPNLDRLAAQGARFTNAFCTNAICTPMRAAILTGQYSHKNGVLDNNGVLPQNAVTIADILGKGAAEGAPGGRYQTAMIGKWHLHRTPTGFDHYDILPGQGDYHNPEFISPAGRRREKGYVTDITIDKSIDWIRARDAARPFILFCHLKAPHRNWQPDDKHAALYNDADIPLPQTFDDDYATRTEASRIQTMTVDRHLTPTDLKVPPPEGLTGAALKAWKYQRYIKDYLRCIASIDDNVGRLMDSLDEQNLANDTIVVYTSDQGFFLGDHGWYDKRFMYEESLRSPLIIRYPREVPAGAVIDSMTIALDYAPTFLDFADVPTPADMQGASLRPILTGHPPADWRQSMYYHYYESGEPHTVPKHYGVRTTRHKLIRFYELPGGPDAQWELYDIEKDPHELNNRYADPAYADTVADLKQQLKRLREQFQDTTGDPL